MTMNTTRLTMYWTVGEAATAIFGIEASWAPQVVAAVAVMMLFGLAWAGADVASRFQFVVMGLLVAALASFYLGAVGGFDGAVAAGAEIMVVPKGDDR